MTHGTLPPIWSQDEIAKAEAQDADHFARMNARQMRRDRLADGVRIARVACWALVGATVALAVRWFA